MYVCHVCLNTILAFMIKSMYIVHVSLYGGTEIKRNKKKTHSQPQVKFKKNRMKTAHTQTPNERRKKN